MRKLLAILSIVMMAMMIVSCSGEEKEGNAAAPAEEGQRDDLVIAISTEPTTLRPASTALVYDEVVINQLYGRLLYHDMDMKVMAHGNGDRAVRAALEAGVDTLEHGNYLEQAKPGIFLARGKAPVAYPNSQAAGTFKWRLGRDLNPRPPA